MGPGPLKVTGFEYWHWDIFRVGCAGCTEAQRAQSSSGDTHHLAPAPSTAGANTRTEVCGEHTGGHGALCSDKELPPELAQVLQSHGQAPAPIWCALKAVHCQDSVCK